VAYTECCGPSGQGKYVHAEHSTQGGNWKTVEPVDGSFPNFWTTEPAMGRVANGVPHRVHRLKGLGNAQVPLQAATAYRLLGGQ